MENLFNTTFLFSFVRRFQIIAGIIKNKVIAILLSSECFGIIKCLCLVHRKLYNNLLRNPQTDKI